MACVGPGGGTLSGGQVMGLSGGLVPVLGGRAGTPPGQAQGPLIPTAQPPVPTHSEKPTRASPLTGV